MLTPANLSLAHDKPARQSAWVKVNSTWTHTANPHEHSTAAMHQPPTTMLDWPTILDDRIPY